MRWVTERVSWFCIATRELSAVRLTRRVKSFSATSKVIGLVTFLKWQIWACLSSLQQDSDHPQLWLHAEKRSQPDYCPAHDGVQVWQHFPTRRQHASDWFLRYHVRKVGQPSIGHDDCRDKRFRPFTFSFLSLQVKYFQYRRANPSHLHSFVTFQGTLAYFNITMANNKFFSVFPSGDYRVHFVLSDDDDDNILKLTFDMSVKSPDKHSFWFAVSACFSSSYTFQRHDLIDCASLRSFLRRNEILCSIHITWPIKLWIQKRFIQCRAFGSRFTWNHRPPSKEKLVILVRQLEQAWLLSTNLSSFHLFSFPLCATINQNQRSRTKNFQFLRAIKSAKMAKRATSRKILTHPNAISWI